MRYFFNIKTMYKITTDNPIELNKEQIADLSEYATITTDDKWFLVELSNTDLFKLSTAIDTLYTYIEDNE